MTGLFPDNVEVQLGVDLTADTTGETLTAVEDMAGFDAVTFLLKFGDIDAAAIITLTVKQNTASSTSSPTPTSVTLVEKSAGVITSGALVITESGGNLDDKIIILHVQGSALSARYVFLSITVTVESYEIDCILTLKHRAKSRPVTQPSDVYAVARAYG